MKRYSVSPYRLCPFLCLSRSSKLAAASLWSRPRAGDIDRLRPCGIATKTSMSYPASYVQFFSRRRSEGWPHHGRTFPIYLRPLLFSLTIPEGLVVSYQHWTSACCHTANICWSLILFLKNNAPVEASKNCAASHFSGRRRGVLGIVFN